MPGLVLAALIRRRIIQPPDLVADMSAQLGVAVGLMGAMAAALGWLVDSGREVVERYPDLAGFGRPPGGLLERVGDELHATLIEPSPPLGGTTERAHVDSTAEERFASSCPGESGSGRPLP